MTRKRQAGPVDGGQKRKRHEEKENIRHGTISDVDGFFEHAKTLNSEKPLKAFAELQKATLVGYFEKLQGALAGKSEKEIRLFRKFATDLPEMATCCIHDGGRYAIWRDDPNSEEILIVHSSGEPHFPKIQVVGDRMEHMLCHLAGKNTAALAHLLPKDADLTKIQAESKRVISQRNKKKLGELPTGVGIWVPVKKEDGLGYRALGEKPDDVRRRLVTVGTSKVEKEVDKAMEFIMEIVAYVQFANDECDFGMGLELAHWLMLANYPQLNSLAKKIAKLAYRLLDRDEYAETVEDLFDELRSPK